MKGITDRDLLVSQYYKIYSSYFRSLSLSQILLQAAALEQHYTLCQYSWIQAKLCPAGSVQRKTKS